MNEDKNNKRILPHRFSFLTIGWWIVHIILILLSTCFFLVGCNNASVKLDNESKIDKVAYEPIGKATYSPVEIPYVIENPIEIIGIDATENDKHQRNYFKISGLVDKNIEDKINASIKGLYEKMIPYTTGEKVPPFRGFRTIIEADREPIMTHISVAPQFNCNNVISITAYVSGTYHKSIHEQFYYSMIESLNLDLSTGKEFLIQDVFTNDIDKLRESSRKDSLNNNSVVNS